REQLQVHRRICSNHPHSLHLSSDGTLQLISQLPGAWHKGPAPRVKSLTLMAASSQRTLERPLQDPELGATGEARALTPKAGLPALEPARSQSRSQIAASLVGTGASQTKGRVWPLRQCSGTPPAQRAGQDRMWLPLPSLAWGMRLSGFILNDYMAVGQNFTAFPAGGRRIETPAPGPAGPLKRHTGNNQSPTDCETVWGSSYPEWFAGSGRLRAAGVCSTLGRDAWPPLLQKGSEAMGVPHQSPSKTHSGGPSRGTPGKLEGVLEGREPAFWFLQGGAGDEWKHALERLRGHRLLKKSEALPISRELKYHFNRLRRTKTQICPHPFHHCGLQHGIWNPTPTLMTHCLPCSPDMPGISKYSVSNSRSVPPTRRDLRLSTSLWVTHAAPPILSSSNRNDTTDPSAKQQMKLRATQQPQAHPCHLSLAGALCPSHAPLQHQEVFLELPLGVGPKFPRNMRFAQKHKKGLKKMQANNATAGSARAKAVKALDGQGQPRRAAATNSVHSLTSLSPILGNVRLPHHQGSQAARGQSPKHKAQPQPTMPLTHRPPQKLRTREPGCPSEHEGLQSPQALGLRGDCCLAVPFVQNT
ncbi:60S ribosomal protein L29, partial [Galemys pyrenaicus]